MRGKTLWHLGAAVLALCVLYVNFATMKSTSIRSAIDDVKEYHLSEHIVGWELGDYFDFRSGLPAPVVLALRTSPILFASCRAAVPEDGEAPADAPLPHLQTAEDAPHTPAVSTAPVAIADNGVPAQTVVPKSSSGYTVADGVFIKNASNKTLDAARLEGTFDAALSGGAPQVLIVHTHGSEAYTPAPGQSYVSTGNYRTNDPRYSVVGVGDEIAAALSAHGISVVHDRTLYDDPLYDGAYERAAAGIRGYLEKYPSIAFVLDVHRDAVQDGSGRQYKLVTREEPHAAQISFVMGSNHDGWEENLKLAAAISRSAAAEHPTLMRPITLRNSNYNQHLTAGSLLVEVGAAGNSPEEAIQAGRYFADAMAKAIEENETLRAAADNASESTGSTP